jgi:hypothetical protein
MHRWERLSLCGAAVHRAVAASPPSSLRGACAHAATHASCVLPTCWAAWGSLVGVDVLAALHIGGCGVCSSSSGCCRCVSTCIHCPVVMMQPCWQCKAVERACRDGHLGWRVVLFAAAIICIHASCSFGGWSLGGAWCCRCVGAAWGKLVDHSVCLCPCYH